jgi:hypothetical protein
MCSVTVPVYQNEGQDHYLVISSLHQRKPDHGPCHGTSQTLLVGSLRLSIL